MQIILALIALICFSSFSIAQQVQARLFAPKNKLYYQPVILGNVNENYYGVKIIPHSGSASNEIILLRFDSVFNKIAEVSHAALMLKEGKYNFSDYLFLKNRLILFYLDHRKGIRYFAAAEVDLQTLKLIGTYESIASCVKTKDDEYIGGYFDGDFEVTASENGKYFVVRYLENNKTKFVFCNDSLKVIWTAESYYNANQSLEDIRINDDGRLFLLESSTIKPARIQTLTEIYNGKLSSTLLVSEEHAIFRSAIGFMPSGKVFVAGYYSYYDSGFSIRNIGTFFFSPSINDGKLVFHPFTQDFLCEGKSDVVKKETKKYFEKYGCAGADGVYSLKLLADKKGKIYLIGEDVLDKALPVDIISSAIVTGNTNWITLVPNENEILSWENLVVTQLDTLGGLKNNTWVPKRQVSNVYASYSAIAANDNLYILFNDNYDNITDPPHNETEIKKLRPISKSIPVFITLAQNGTLKKSLPFGNENFMSVEMTGVFTSGREMIFCAKQKGDFVFGKFETE